MTASLTIPKTNQSNSKQALPKVVQIDSGINERAVAFRNKLGFVPKGASKQLTELFFAGSFVSAIFLALRASLMELMPKALVGGIIRAKTNEDASNNSQQSNSSNTQTQPNIWNILKNLFSGKTKFNTPVAMDEVFLELTEYIAMYFMPTLASVGLFSRMIGKNLGIDFEFFGKPMHIYEGNLGKEVELGTLERKRLFINKENLSKLALGKSLLFAAVIGFCGALEYIVPSVRDFMTKWFLGFESFSQLLGFKDDLDDPDYKDPLKRASDNIKHGLWGMAATMAGIWGLSLFFKNKVKSPKVENFFRKFSKHLDLDSNFQLSNTPLAIILIFFAIPGYMRALRGKDEKVEVFNRIVLYSIPTIVMYKQTVLDVLTILSSLYHGAGGDVMKLFPQMSNQVKDGKRDPLDWNLLSDFKAKDKNFNPKASFLSRTLYQLKSFFSLKAEGFEYEGMITKLPSLQNMTQERRESFLNSVRVINKMPLFLAFAIGAVINFFNLQIIFNMHEEQSKKNKDSTSKEAPKSPLNDNFNFQPMPA